MHEPLSTQLRLSPTAFENRGGCGASWRKCPPPRAAGISRSISGGLCLRTRRQGSGSPWPRFHRRPNRCGGGAL